MIGAIFSPKYPHLSLTTLEEIWISNEPSTGILSTLQPTLAKILLKRDQTLFLDTMKFVAMLVSELFGKAEKEVLAGFTERFLAAAHCTANRFYSNHTFDQHRFLDCISAILSVWTDCTKQQELIIPKYVVYTRGSHIHVLDAILQSLNISDQIKCKLLDQITSLSNTELFVKYTIVGREFAKHKLHSLSEQPSEDTFRCWLLKHNITTIRSVSDFLNSNRSDEDLLSAMCRPFYNLPLSSDSPATDTAADEPEINPDSLFFFDRGTKPAKSEKNVEEKEEVIVRSDKEEPMSTDSSPKAPLAPKADTVEEEKVDVPENSQVEETVKRQEVPEPSIAVEAQPFEPPESCIKIRNLRKRRGKVATPSTEVIVVKCPTTKPSTPPSHMKNKSSSSAPLTEERLSTLPDKPSAQKSTRKRRTSDVSVVSVTSVDSVASRTRNRARAETVESLKVITEEGGKTVDRAASIRKLRTPAIKFTPKAKETTSERGKSRKVSETIDETPQIPVRKTRSRKLEV